MTFMSQLFKPKYLTIDKEDVYCEDDDLTSHNLCQVCSESNKSSPKSCLRPERFWVFSTFFLLFLIGVVAVFEISITRKSQNGAFTTELSTARSEVSFRPVAFTGNINFDKNGKTYLEREPGSKVYSGPPTDEMDENWHELLQKRYFFMTEAEVVDSWGLVGLEKYYYELGPNDERKYVGGLDVLHTLHCVEGLRQTLDPERYTVRRAKLHLYHCIDHIRQWIMCSGDFTPIPTRWHPEKNSSYVDTDQIHTCRNFDAVAEWVRKREAA